MPETLTDKLLVAILGGIVLWLITGASRFLLYRYGLARALIEDIKHRRSNLKETKEYLNTYFSDNVKAGVALNSYANYTKQGFPFFEDIRKELFKYFTASDMIAIMRCYEAFEEVEILTEGLLHNFQKHVEGKQVLSSEDVAKLNRRKERIIRVIDILGQGELRNVKDIPRDYKGMMSAVDVIRK